MHSHNGCCSQLLTWIQFMIWKCYIVVLVVVTLLAQIYMNEVRRMVDRGTRGTGSMFTCEHGRWLLQFSVLSRDFGLNELGELYMHYCLYSILWGFNFLFLMKMLVFGFLFGCTDEPPVLRRGTGSRRCATWIFKCPFVRNNLLDVNRFIGVLF